MGPCGPPSQLKRQRVNALLSMHAPMSLLMSLSLFSLLVTALDLNGNVQWNEQCPGYKHIQGAKVVLDDGRRYGNIRKDGQFTIPDVGSGTFVLSVISHDFHFDQIRVDVSNAETHPTIHPYISGTPLSPASPIRLPYPISLSARSKNAYFVEREGFNPLDMLKSPMMLIMIVTAGMLFATPYLMANMDQDTLKEVQGRQNKMAAAQNSIQNMDISGLANLLGGESDSTNTPKPSPLPTSGKGKGKGKKR